MSPPIIKPTRHQPPIPSGYILGRKSGGTGPAELLSIRDLIQANATAAVPSAIAAAIKAGANITITDNGDGTYTIASTGGAGGSSYIGIPAGLDQSTSNTSGPGFFLGRMLVMPKATTINSVVVPISVTAATPVLTPAIYGVTTAFNISPLLATGPSVTGVTRGIQTLPLTSGLVVTQGQVIWAGYVVTVAGVTVVGASALGSVFFTAAGAPPNPAAAPTYNSTLGSPMWVSE